MSNYISFKQALFNANFNDDINYIVNQYKEIMSFISRNTMFQLSHYELINEGLDYYDYIVNDDISQTTFNKIKDYIIRVNDILLSKEFADNIQVAQLVAKIMTNK